MDQRTMVRSLFVGLLSLSLLAAPAAAAGPAQPADSPRSGWLVEFGDFLSRAVGLLFSDWTGESSIEEADATDDGIRSVTAEDDGHANTDPDG